MRTNYVLLSAERSGSSLLQRMLGEQPEIKVVHEVLRTWRKRGEDPVKILSKLFTSNPKFPVFGLKIQYGHMSPEIEAYIAKPEIKVIQLIRRDLLEVVLWDPRFHTGDTSGGLGPPLVLKEGGSITAKIPEVLDYIELLSGQISEYRHLADFTVYYDDMTDGSDATEFFNIEVRRKLLGLLGLKDRKLRPPPIDSCSKNKRPPNEECVTNWDKLMGEIENEGIDIYYGGE